VIDILIPVLGRPERAQPLADNIHHATTVPHRIWWLCTEGDDLQIAACLETGHPVYTGVYQQGHEYPTKINLGFFVSDAAGEHYPYVFNASDDLEFRRGWDDSALAVMEMDYFIPVNVVATNDQANSQVKKGQFGTHCLIRRSYINQQGGSLDGPGYVLHEGYDHNFVDRELCHLAQHRGVYAYAKNSVVRHHHPLHDHKIKMDATYRKGLANFRADQQLFWRRAAQWDYEGLSPQEKRIARNQLAKR
jgi:hypothetical protein